MAERCSGDGWCGLTFAEVLVYAFFDLPSSLLEKLLRLEDLQIMIELGHLLSSAASFCHKPMFEA